jgi:alkanesulfonate monooxygenase SsuD/methylene tetrahydromethanopterin reductase-like flavin-dependent oxidoreductase (luciferase family)
LGIIRNEKADLLSEMRKNIIIGNPQQVKKRIEELQVRYNADEIMIVTITHSPADKVQSYKLIAEEILRYK